MVGSKLVIIATLEIVVDFLDVHTASQIQPGQVSRMVDALVTNSIPMDPFEGEITAVELQTYRVVEEE